MKVKQPELCVGLAGRLTRVARHWQAVNEELPPEFPLVLLAGETCAQFQLLAASLPGLQDALLAAQMELKIAWGRYELRKRGMHEWLKGVAWWLRGNYQGLDVMAARRRIPGRGQSFGHWWEAAEGALLLWKNIEADPPPLPPGYDPGTPLQRTLAEFEADVRAFHEAWCALGAAEVELNIARGALRLAQDRGTTLLMAYGHGVRGRLGSRNPLLKAIPRLWPARGSLANRRRAA